MHRELEYIRETGLRVKQKYEEQDSFGINTVKNNIESCIISQTVDAFLDMQEVVRSNPEHLENATVPPPIYVLELMISVMKAYKKNRAYLNVSIRS